MKPAITRPTAILFDWDNTLVETWGVIHESMNLTLAAMGHKLWTREETESRVRGSLRDTFPDLFGARWKDAEKVFYDSFEAVHLQHLKPVSGAEDLLKDLRGLGCYLAVVSNKRGPFLRREAEHLGWSGYFQKLAGAGDAARDKPALDHVELALSAGGPPRNPDVWFVGDADIDLVCAKTAGCRPILLRAKSPVSGEFAAAAPELYFADIAAFRRHLAEI